MLDKLVIMCGAVSDSLSETAPLVVTVYFVTAKEAYNMNGRYYANTVRQVLVESIDHLDTNKALYLQNPEKDFSRKRKLPFDTIINQLLQMESGTLQAELLKYHNFSDDTPTKSAFCQQRAKISPEALKDLFFSFTKKLIEIDTPKTSIEGYLLLAGDGSDINIPYNCSDTETYHQNAGKRGYNQLHLNALYDLLNGIYIDIVVEPASKSHERAALIEMVDRYDLPFPAIFTADRGYEGYNMFAHLLSSGQKFLIRLKDPDSNGIISTYDFEPIRSKNKEFDCDISTILTHRQTREVKENWDTYTFVARSHLDYPDGSSVFPLNLRIVCIEVKDGVYEYLATNLDRSGFNSARLKELYHLRWGIETSFRDLKYTIDLLHFHGRKRHYVEQEIWARLTVYNFCEAITRHTTAEKKNFAKHDVKINFATAACICKAFLRQNNGEEIDVCRLIGRFLIPIRPDRSAARNVKPQSAKIFIYRAA